MAIDAVKNFATSSEGSQNVNINALLCDRSTRLKQFFTSDSKNAPCVSYAVDTRFWKSVDNNNRSTERRIGELRDILQERRVKSGQERPVESASLSLNQTDIRLHSYLCTMK